MLVFCRNYHPALPSSVGKESSKLPSGEDREDFFNYFSFSLYFTLSFKTFSYNILYLMSQLLPYSSYSPSHPTPCLLSVSFLRKQTRLPTQNKINGMFSTFCLISLCKEAVLGLKYQERLKGWESISMTALHSVYKTGRLILKLKNMRKKLSFQPFCTTQYTEFL